jgi:hypothetical protein
MIIILGLVITLVAWSLHLMQEAIDRKEFSLMLAGFLVASAATGLMAVYFLAGPIVSYYAQVADHLPPMISDSDPIVWVMPVAN